MSKSYYKRRREIFKSKLYITDDNWKWDFNGINRRHSHGGCHYQKIDRLIPIDDNYYKYIPKRKKTSKRYKKFITDYPWYDDDLYFVIIKNPEYYNKYIRIYNKESIRYINSYI